MYSSSDFVNDVATVMCEKCPSKDEECDELDTIATCAIRAIRYAMEEGW